MTNYPKPMKEIIYETILKMGGTSTINDMYEKIRTKYPKIEISRNTVSTQMSDLSINGPDSSGYPMHKRFLKRIGRGVYEITKERNFQKSSIQKQSRPRHTLNHETVPSHAKWNQNKITVIGEPYTFATAGEIPWKQTMMDSIPEKIDQKYSGAELKFHYVPNIHGQPLDVDNLCEPVFTILVGKKRYFEGRKNNIQWFKAEKTTDITGKLELSLSEKSPEIPMDFVIFDKIYQGELPKSATDKEFAEFVKINSKEKLRINDECKIKIQFHSSLINLGNISSGTVKPIIDCLYPILGGKVGAPDDHSIRLLVVEKGIRDIPQNSVRIMISKFSDF